MPFETGPALALDSCFGIVRSIHFPAVQERPVAEAFRQVASHAPGDDHHPKDRNGKVRPDMDIGKRKDVDESQHPPPLVGPVEAVTQFQGQQPEPGYGREPMNVMELLERYMEEKTAEQQACKADVRSSEQDIKQPHRGRTMRFFPVRFVFICHQELAPS